MWHVPESILILPESSIIGDENDASNLNLRQQLLESRCDRFVSCPKISIDRRTTMLVNPLAENADASICADSTSIQLRLLTEESVSQSEGAVRQGLQSMME
jgi:hypothetical protein